MVVMRFVNHLKYYILICTLNVYILLELRIFFVSQGLCLLKGNPSQIAHSFNYVKF